MQGVASKKWSLGNALSLRCSRLEPYPHVRRPQYFAHIPQNPAYKKRFLTNYQSRGTKIYMGKLQDFGMLMFLFLIRGILKTVVESDVAAPQILLKKKSELTRQNEKGQILHFSATQHNIRSSLHPTLSPRHTSWQELHSRGIIYQAARHLSFSPTRCHAIQSTHNPTMIGLLSRLVRFGEVLPTRP